MTSLGSRATLEDMFTGSINYRGKSVAVDSVSLLPDCAGRWILDYGCGQAPKRKQILSFGARWVGIDVAGSDATIRCDGHMLPFKDGAFDAVLADAVFEHLVNPFKGMQEIARVCKRGGRVVGYVAFLEPFHVSYFHHSHRSIEHLLGMSGFVVTDILPSRSGIEKLVEDMLFPSRIRFVTFIVSMGVRSVLFTLKRLLWGAAAAAPFLKGERREARRRKLELYRTFLEVAYAAGLTFRGVKA